MPTDVLQADIGKAFSSGKSYVHSDGLSCTFRQWRAKDSHCRFLHGYALQVEISFYAIGGLDDRNWVINFGGMKEVKAWLEATFDHKTLVAHDDPLISTFRELATAGMIQLVNVEHVGAEAFAKMIYDWVFEWLRDEMQVDGRVVLDQVTVREHDKNWASYG